MEQSYRREFPEDTTVTHFRARLLSIAVCPLSLPWKVQKKFYSVNSASKRHIENVFYALTIMGVICVVQGGNSKLNEKLFLNVLTCLSSPSPAHRLPIFSAENSFLNNLVPRSTAVRIGPVLAAGLIPQDAKTWFQDPHTSNAYSSAADTWKVVKKSLHFLFSMP